MTTLSFDQIRKQMAATQGQATPVDAKAPSKVVEAAKFAKNAVQGVLPVSNNRLTAEMVQVSDLVDDRTESLLRLIVRTSMEVEVLRSQLGLRSSEISKETVDAVAASLLSAIKNPPVREVVEQVAPEVAPEAPVVPSVPLEVAAPVNVAPVAEAAVAPFVAGPSNPMMNDVIQMSQPSNWHLGGPQQ